MLVCVSVYQRMGVSVYRCIFEFGAQYFDTQYANPSCTHCLSVKIGSVSLLVEGLRREKCMFAVRSLPSPGFHVSGVSNWTIWGGRWGFGECLDVLASVASPRRGGASLSDECPRCWWKRNVPYVR